MFNFVCCNCKKEITVSKYNIEEHEGATLNCPECGYLHIIDAGEVVDFHSLMNKRSNGVWPAKGERTESVEV